MAVIRPMKGRVAVFFMREIEGDERYVFDYVLLGKRYFKGDV